MRIRQRCPLPNGLHARPASDLAAHAKRFASSITLINDRTGKRADAKSPLSTITLDLRYDEPFEVIIDGKDEADAHVGMTRFLEDRFPHCDAPLPKIESLGGATPLSPCLVDAGIECLRGTPAVGGIGEGTFVHWHRTVTLPPDAAEPVDDVDRECRRVRAAIDRVIGRHEAKENGVACDAARDLITAQRSILEDEQFNAHIEIVLRRDRCSAGVAIETTACELGDMLRATDNPILASRADDIDDIARQLLEELYGAGVATTLPVLTGETVITADRLLPSEFLSLDTTRLRGLVLGNTSATSHVVILARARGIPTLVGVDLSAARGALGHCVIVDGESGILALRLNDAVNRYYEMERRRIADRVRFDANHLVGPARAEHVPRVRLLGNGSTLEDLDRARRAGAVGVGLLRTELLFADWQAAPTEDEQYDLYRCASAAMDGAPVTIRLFDCGGDKPLAFMPAPAEPNPFLGWRGVRMYEAYGAIIDAQIRAILRASAHGPVRILVPMVSSPAEMERVRARIDRSAKALRKAGVTMADRVPVGVMLEVPSAVYVIDQLAAHSDFFSVGTNDLAQYFAAADRENPRVATSADVLAPAFLRMLKTIAEASLRAGRPWGMCGEMAGDAAALPLLLALGADDLSMAPESLPRVRSRLSRIDPATCGDLLKDACAARSGEDVRAMLARFTGGGGNLPLIEPALALSDVDCRSQAEAIKLLVDRLHALGRTNAPHALEQAVWRRERASPTGLGFGFAVPHCKSDLISASSISVLQLRQPIMWHGDGDTPTRFVFLLAVRESESASEYMDVLKTLAVKIMDETFRAEIASAHSGAALFRILSDTLSVGAA